MERNEITRALQSAIAKIDEQRSRIQALEAELAGVRDRLARTQWMLETIDRSHSTNFAEVRDCIVANRAILHRGEVEPQS